MSDLKTTGIKQERLLYAVLNTNKIELESIIKHKANYYFSFEKIKRDKRNKIVYINGQPKKRKINATNGRLKKLQELIDVKILKSINLPANVKGGVKGSCNIANAQAHLGKHYKFKTDIKQYFPSISHNRVFEMFLCNGFSRKVATLLTHLTTNKYQLPQGTPTSTSIANLVFVPSDYKIIEFCSKNRLFYTRYVDDLVFSSQFDFKDKISSLIKFIIEDDFRISVEKTIYRAGSMEITGILTKQNVLDVTEEYKELVTDRTVASQTTEARIKYIKRVRSYLRKLVSPTDKFVKDQPSKLTLNKNIFNISFLHKDRNQTYAIEFINYGYTYRFYFNVKGKLFYCEPDEERNLRVMVHSKDLKDAYKIDKMLLKKIAEVINNSFQDNNVQG